MGRLGGLSSGVLVVGSPPRWWSVGFSRSVVVVVRVRLLASVQGAVWEYRLAIVYIVAFCGLLCCAVYVICVHGAYFILCLPVVCCVV